MFPICANQTQSIQSRLCQGEKLVLYVLDTFILEPVHGMANSPTQKLSRIQMGPVELAKNKK